MKSPNCKRCGRPYVDGIAPKSGRMLRWCPVCAERARKLRNAARPEIPRARSAVQAALKSGELVRKPCEVCGNPQSEAHHVDYAHALQVRWLCRFHHARVHAALRKAGALASKGR